MLYLVWRQSRIRKLCTRAGMPAQPSPITSPALVSMGLISIHRVVSNAAQAPRGQPIGANASAGETLARELRSFLHQADTKEAAEPGRAWGLTPESLVLPPASDRSSRPTIDCWCHEGPANGARLSTTHSNSIKHCYVPTP
jgi:hypothetical protein